MPLPTLRWWQLRAKWVRYWIQYRNQIVRAHGAEGAVLEGQLWLAVMVCNLAYRPWGTIDFLTGRLRLRCPLPGDVVEDFQRDTIYRLTGTDGDKWVAEVRSGHCHRELGRSWDHHPRGAIRVYTKLSKDDLRWMSPVRTRAA